MPPNKPYFGRMPSRFLAFMFFNRRIPFSQGRLPRDQTQPGSNKAAQHGLT